jgi:hypothetical protein
VRAAGGALHGLRHASGSGAERKRGPGGGAMCEWQRAETASGVGSVAHARGGGGAAGTGSSGASARECREEEADGTRRGSRPTMRHSRGRRGANGEAEAPGECTAEGEQEVRAQPREDQVQGLLRYQHLRA